MTILKKLACAAVLSLGLATPQIASASLFDDNIVLTISDVIGGPFSDTVDASSGFTWSFQNGTNIGDDFLLDGETIQIESPTRIVISAGTTNFGPFTLKFSGWEEQLLSVTPTFDSNFPSDFIANVDLQAGSYMFQSNFSANSTTTLDFAFAAIPLPAGFVLLLSALGGLTFLKRRASV